MQWSGLSVHPSKMRQERWHSSFVLALPLPVNFKNIILNLIANFEPSSKICLEASWINALISGGNSNVVSEENIKHAVIEVLRVADLVGAGFFGGLEFGSRFPEAAVTLRGLKG
jgi:hypothetical protein